MGRSIGKEKIENRMRAKLFSKQGVMKGKQSQDTLSFEFDNEATIGRSEQNEIALNRKEISKVHARIFLDPAKTCYYLEDLASANGTQLDGVKVYGKERLGHLHVITFSGAFDFIFIDNDLCKKRHPAQGVTTPTESAPLVEDVTIAKVTPQKIAQQPTGIKPQQVVEQHFILSSKPAAGTVEDKTIREEKPFVLPQGLGKSKAVETEDKTMVEEKPFVLPPSLSKGKK